MKRFFLAAFLLALAAAAVPAPGFAANEVTFDDNFTLQLPSDGTLYSVYKNGKVNSITVNTASFTFTMEAGSVVEMTSADRKRFDNTISAITVCQADNSFVRLRVQDDSPAQTVTVTPTGNACSSAGGGVVSSSSSGGSSGGGGTPAPAPQVVQTAPTSSAPQPSVVSAPQALMTLEVSRLLSVGSRGDDVRSLQEYLAQDPELYPEGTVSGYFGPATRRAIQKFQEKYGIAVAGDQGYGLVGPRTRAKLAELTARAIPAAVEPPVSAPSAPVSSAPTPEPTPAVVITRSLALGAEGDDVRALQEYLAGDSELYPEGRVTGFFGPATRKAIQRFQEKYGIAVAGDQGYGLVGPRTREKLAELSAGSAPAPESAESSAPIPSPAPTTPSVPSAGAITRSLAVGVEGDDVRTVQEYLARDSELYPEGRVTGFFGPATRAAIQRFQEKYGIASAGDAGYGLVGPKTRAKLNEVISEPVISGEAPLSAPSAPAPKPPSGVQIQQEEIFKQIQEIQKQIDLLKQKQQ